jgi:hypothetical protein
MISISLLNSLFIYLLLSGLSSTQNIIFYALVVCCGIYLSLNNGILFLLLIPSIKKQVYGNKSISYSSGKHENFMIYLPEYVFISSKIPCSFENISAILIFLLVDVNPSKIIVFPTYCLKIFSS